MAASETSGWLLARSRSPGVLLRMLVACLEGLWLTGIERRWNADHIRVRCRAAAPALRQDKDE